jgi:uncharacterized protein DUF4105
VSGRAHRAGRVAGLTLLAMSLAWMPARSTPSSQAVSPPRSVTPGSELTISVMTMGVGAESWERFGHNAIVVEDRSRGTKVSYNYGMFSFRQENFLLRFAQGRMLYWVDSMDTDWDVERYRAAHRSVWLQELNLSPAQRVALRDFLEWNVRPENRFYRYDYYRDNCSTRVRDAVDRVVGGAFKAATDTLATGVTYRFHTQRLNTNNPFLYTGLLLAVGQGGDRQLSAWDEMFLPLKLRQHLRLVRVADSTGAQVPLVRSERTVYESSSYPVPERKPDWRPGYLAVGLVLAALLAASGLRWAGTAAGRVTLLGLGGLWVVVSGVGGGILAMLWGFTDHVIASVNENVLQLDPLTLLLLVLLPLGLARGGAWLERAERVALVVAGLSAMGVLLKLLPPFHQANGEILALAVPLNLGLALGLRGWTRSVRPTPSPR